MIGFYDSGLGGLTIVNEFLKLYPQTKTVYLADTLNCPLGNKTNEEILRITKRGVEFLFSQGCRLVVLACNTATSVAIRPIQQEWLPARPEFVGRNVLGVVKPVTEELINRKESVEPILLLATSATCRSRFYQQELALEGFKEFDCLSLPHLAQAIEEQDTFWIEQILREVANQADLAKYRSFVLACTHYPIVKEKIRQIFSFTIKHPFEIFDQSALVPKRLAAYLQRHPEYSLLEGDLQIVVSGGQVDIYAQKIKSLFPELNFHIYPI
jgi:glutamate racemase